MTRTCCIFVALSCAAFASADTINFCAMIDGAQNGNSSPATGVLDGVFDTDTSSFSFSWEITDQLLSTPAAPGAHIHQGAEGVAGPIVFAFETGSWELTGAAIWTGMSIDEINALMNGDLYVNFHTTDFPGGEVRGQINKVPAPGAVALFGLGGLAATRRRR